MEMGTSGDGDTRGLGTRQGRGYDGDVLGTRMGTRRCQDAGRGGGDETDGGADAHHRPRDVPVSTSPCPRDVPMMSP